MATQSKDRDLTPHVRLQWIGREDCTDVYAVRVSGEALGILAEVRTPRDDAPVYTIRHLVGDVFARRYAPEVAVEELLTKHLQASQKRGELAAKMLFQGNDAQRAEAAANLESARAAHDALRMVREELAEASLAIAMGPGADNPDDDPPF